MQNASLIPPHIQPIFTLLFLLPLVSAAFLSSSSPTSRQQQTSVTSIRSDTNSLRIPKYCHGVTGCHRQPSTADFVNLALSNLGHSPFYTTARTPAITSTTRKSFLALSSDDSPADESRIEGIDISTLADMDIVLFSMKKQNDETSTTTDDDSTTTTPKYQLGAIQEDKTLAPLSAWTLEGAFTDPDTGSESIEFLVDEEDRFRTVLSPENLVVHSVLDSDVIGYGSRQVGGGKGPGNPHGEESELLYYVDRSVLEDYEVDVVVNPELEILW